MDALCHEPPGAETPAVLRCHIRRNAQAAKAGIQGVWWLLPTF